MVSRKHGGNPANPLARVSPGRPRTGLVEILRHDPMAQRMLTSVQHRRQEDIEFSNRTRTLREKVFGSKSPRDKRIAEMEANCTDTVCGFFEKQIALQCNTLLERYEDVAETWKIAGRINLRRELIEFVTSQLDELKAKIEESRARFTETVRRRAQRLEANRDLEVLFDVETEDLRSEVERHYVFLRQLEEHFLAAVTDRIEKDGHPSRA